MLKCHKRTKILDRPLKTLENAIDVPEEICDLVPQKTCRGVYKLVPYLVPEPECKDVPREVCSFGVKGTKLGEKPIVTKVTKQNIVTSTSYTNTINFLYVYNNAVVLRWRS